MIHYGYEITHVPGMYLYTTDTSLRVPIQSHNPCTLQTETEAFVAAVISCLPATSHSLP